MNNVHPIMQAAIAPWAPPPSAVEWAQATARCAVRDCPSAGRPRHTGCDCSRDTEALAAKALLQLDSLAEQQRIAADHSYNALKSSGELQQREADRALVEQLKWEAV